MTLTDAAADRVKALVAKGQESTVEEQILGLRVGVKSRGCSGLSYFVEYAKESAEDILIQISVHNRGPEAAALHVLPTLWFRNQWSWQGVADRPGLQQSPGQPGWSVE